MTKENLIAIIENRNSWTLAKHRSALMLLDNFKDNKVIEYLWYKFKSTGDYYYASIVKSYKVK
jgi:hypothetical protein